MRAFVCVAAALVAVAALGAGVGALASPPGPTGTATLRNVLAGLLLATALGGCVSSQPVRIVNGGTLKGVLMFGGPGPSKPVRGQVTAVQFTGRRFSLSTHADGRFTMSLPPGRFRLYGRSPKVTLNGNPVRCRATHSVRIRRRMTTERVAVICGLV